QLEMIGRAIGCIVLALCFADARVDFPTSRIYDEFDFKGQSAVTIDGLCSQSCLIFASVTPESQKFANNLLIQLPKGFVSVYDIARSVDPVSNQKIYEEIKNTPTLTIVNANSPTVSGPVVLYIVEGSGGSWAGTYNTEIYEAEGFFRPNSTHEKSPGFVTVMSARPFTLKQAPRDIALPTSLAVMAGFDALKGDESPCPFVYYSMGNVSATERKIPRSRSDAGPSHNGFTLEVNGPIVTVMFDQYDPSNSPGDLSATIGITNKRLIQTSGWVGSPGFHGCDGQQPYRSSLYDFTTPIHTEITSYGEEQQVKVDVLTNADVEHAVSLISNIESPYSIIGTGGNDAVTTLYFAAKKLNMAINWTPDGTEHTHFLVRWNGPAR
ncbi:hypothetical protein PENTCL1PPCAC_24093, partial [Pristionchus entomophagus]